MSNNLNLFNDLIPVGIDEKNESQDQNLFLDLIDDKAGKTIDSSDETQTMESNVMGSKSDDGFLDLPEVTMKDVDVPEVQAINRFKKKFGGLGFDFEKATSTITGGIGQDKVVIIAPADENGNRERLEVQTDLDVFGMSTYSDKLWGASSKQTAEDINEFVKKHSQKSPINTETYAAAWNIADKYEIKNNKGKIKKMKDLTSEELSDHMKSAYQTALHSDKLPGVKEIFEEINVDLDNFTEKTINDLRGKYDLTDLKQVELANKELTELVDKKQEELFNQNQEIKNIQEGVFKAVESRFGSTLDDKLRKEAEDAHLPTWITNFNSDYIRQGYITAAIKFPKALKEVNILHKGIALKKANEEIESLKKLDPNASYTSLDPEGKYQPTGLTNAGRIKYLESKRANLNKDIGFKLAEQQEYQRKLEDVRVPTIFGKDISDPDLTLDEWQGMLGDQTVQMISAVLTMGGSTYIQEGGGAALDIIRIEAAKKMFPKLEVEQALQAFDKEKQKDRAAAMADILNKGEANLMPAVGVGIANAGLDLASNFFVIGKATKFAPVSLGRHLLRGRVGKFLSEGAGVAKDIGKASFVEFITETSQEGTSIAGVKAATGYGGNKDANIKRLAEAGGQALLSTGPLVGAGKVATTTAKEIRAKTGIAWGAEVKSTRNAINQIKKEYEQYQKDGTITIDQLDEIYTELEAQEDFINNTKYKKLDNKSKIKVIDNLVEIANQKKDLTKLENESKKTKKQQKDTGGLNPNTIQSDIKGEIIKNKIEELQLNNLKELWKNDLTTNLEFAEWINNQTEGFFADKAVMTFDNVEDAKNFIEGNNLEQEAGKNPLEVAVNLKMLYDGDVNGANLGNVAVIVNDNVRKSIDANYGDWSSSNVIHHEAFHFILDAIPVSELQTVRNQVISELEASTDPKIQAALKLHKGKMDLYTEDKRTREYNEEWFAVLSDAMRGVKNNDINLENGVALEGVGKIFGGLFQGVTKKGFDFTKFDAQNALEFIKKYNDFNGKSPGLVLPGVKGKVDVQPLKKKGIDFKLSKVVNLDDPKFEGMELSERIDSYTRGAKTKEDLFTKDPKTRTSAFDDIYTGMVQGAFDRIFGEGVSSDQKQIQRQNLADRFAGLTEEGGYDPSKTAELSKWMYGGSGKAGNIIYAGLTAKKKLFEKGEKAKKEVRGDVVTETGKTVFEGIADKKTVTKKPITKKDKARKLQQLKDIPLNNKKIISESLKNKLKILIEKNPNNLEVEITKLIENDIRKAIVKEMGEISNVKVGEKIVDGKKKDIKEIKISDEYKAFHALAYDDIVKSLDVNTIKNNYKNLFDLKKIGKEDRVNRKIDNPNLKKDSYYRKDIFEIGTNKAKWTKYFTEGGYTTLKDRQKKLAILIGESITDDVVNKYIADNSNNLSEIIKAELRNYSNSLNRRKGEKYSFDSIKFSAVVRGFNPAELKTFYNNLSNLGDILLYTNVRDEETVYSAIDKIYGKFYSTSKVKKLSKDLYKIIKRYSDIEQRHANLNTQPEKTLNEYLFDNIKAAELEMNLAQFLELKDEFGKYIKISNSFDNIDRINNMRAEIVTLGQKLVKKYGKQVALIMLVHSSGMYATSTKIGRGKFKVDENGIIYEIIPADIGKEAFGSQRYQAFDGKKDFNKNVLKKIFPELQLTNAGNLKKFQTLDGVVDRKGKPRKIDISLLAEKSKEAMQDKDFKAREAQAKISEQFVKDISQHYKDQIVKEVLDKEDFAMLMMSMASNMQSPLKRAANLKYTYKDKKGKKYKGELRYEHMIPTNYMVMKITSAYISDTKVDLDALFKEYTVAIIPSTMDDIFEEMGLVHVMPIGFEAGQSARVRYYNMSTYGHPDLYAIESIDPKDKGKVYGELASNMKFSKSIKTLHNAITKARTTKFSKTSKGITVLDFDDTLATTKSLVKFTRPDGTTGTLNAEEYASTYEDLLDQGFTFDFSDFNKVVKGKLAPLFNKAMKLQGKFGPENMFVLTARPPAAQKAIFDFLKANGLNIPLKNITGLGNSTAEAKALWIADKVGEGYNDFYFADDALQNVQAVKNMLDQFDVKSKVQQAKVKFSKSMNNDFNSILENVTGIEAKKRFSAVKARKRGASKGKFRFFIPPSHEDFVGLLYNFIGKGKEGNKHRDFFEQALIRPLNRAFRELNAARQSIANDYKSLNKQFKNVKKKLNKKTPDGDFTYQDAIRVYLWDKHGHNIPGLTPTDQQNLVDLVKSDPELQNYAETLNVISKREDYVKPSEGWEVTDIRMDLDDATGRIGRAEFLAEFLENADIIFSPENLNKIEAAYGPDMVSAIKDMLYRIETGRNRPSGSNKLVNGFMNWFNSSVAATMFINVRSVVLQQMSLVNFINYSDNNIYAAAKAFANQKQYWKDFAFLFNSDFMKQRRGGIKTDVNGAELAESLKGAKNNPITLLNKLLQLGFKPTQIGDNVAIATGGATYYRNRVNTYLKQGLSQKEAEAKAFVDFQVLAEATQQSARPDMVSQQQASPLGKIILAFQNVTSQFNRLGKKAFLDIKNRRISPEYKSAKNPQLQSDISNASRIAYYFAIQSLIFYTLQSALFMAMFDDDEDDEQLLKDKERVIHGTIDSVLRGTGVWGAFIATLKNMAIKRFENEGKDWRANEYSVLAEALQVSPPLGARARKLVKAERELIWDKKIIKEMETFDIENPLWPAVTNYIEGTTNAPLNRSYNLTLQAKDGLDNQFTALQRALRLGGWSRWNVGIEGVKKSKKKEKFGSKKKSTNTMFFDLQ
jgi:hypothetical protein